MTGVPPVVVQHVERIHALPETVVLVTGTALVASCQCGRVVLEATGAPILGAVRLEEKKVRSWGTVRTRLYPLPTFPGSHPTSRRNMYRKRPRSRNPTVKAASLTPWRPLRSSSAAFAIRTRIK